MKISAKLSTLILLVFFSFGQDGYSQTNYRSFFVEAESYFLFEEYKEALPLYQRILREEPNNYNVMYKIGICYLNDPYQRTKSIKYLEAASQHINPKYRENSYKEKQSPQEVLFYLARAYRINLDLDKALTSYNRFKKILDPTIFDVEVVNEEIASVQNAMQALKEPAFFDSRNAGDVINTRFSETNPIVSGNGQKMVFVRKLQFYDAVFITERQADGAWTEPYNLTPDFGLDGNSYPTGISFDGTEILVYRSDDFDGNIYISKLIDDKWSKLELLGENVNTKYWESHASFSPDGEYMYLASNRYGGYGGLDIYRLKRMKSGKWGRASNLGPIVNSPYNDDTPFLSSDGKILFLSSEGHESIGGYDIFYTQQSGDGKWKKPKNMGYPISTTDDDQFYSPVDGDFKAVVSLYDPVTSKGLSDIYFAKVYNDIFLRDFTIKGQLNPDPGMDVKYKALQVSLVDKEKGEVVQKTKLNNDGSFELNAVQGDYALLIDGKGIKPISVPVKLEVAKPSNLVELGQLNVEYPAVGEEHLAVVPTAPPVLEADNEQYMVSDSMPVYIKLKVEKASKLEISTLVEGEPILNETAKTKSKTFTYAYQPMPGENIVKFKITDSHGGVNTQEVLVYYEPKAESVAEQLDSIVHKENINVPIAFLGILPPSINNYLADREGDDFSNLSELYYNLMNNADKYGYSDKEIEEFISIYATQDSKTKFIGNLSQENPDILKSVADSSVEYNAIPVGILGDMRARSQVEEELNQALENISKQKAGAGMLSGLQYIASFGEMDGSLGGEASFETFVYMAGDSLANRSLDLASTTNDLSYFYQNLLFASDSSLSHYLLGLRFEKDSIYNAIDLLDHLFNMAGTDYSIDELLTSLDNAASGKSNFMQKFKDSLTAEAEGNLKLALREYQLPEDGQSYDNFIQDLIRIGDMKGYTLENVYQLLIDMIGIERVDEFLAEMSQYAEGDIQKVLDGSNVNDFSRPIEIIQYLLSQTGAYNYTASNINDLLLRMLLEKGLEGNRSSSEVDISDLTKNRDFIRTIILANIIILLIIVLLVRKKKQKE